jgi:hypothetical protein
MVADDDVRHWRQGSALCPYRAYTVGPFNDGWLQIRANICTVLGITFLIKTSEEAPHKRASPKQFQQESLRSDGPLPLRRPSPAQEEEEGLGRVGQRHESFGDLVHHSPNPDLIQQHRKCEAAATGHPPQAQEQIRRMKEGREILM